MNERGSSIQVAQPTSPTASGPGYCRLAGYGILKVAGADAEKLLQGQTTCDVVAVPAGGTTHGALCTPKGRVIANFRLLREEAAFYLLMPTDMVSIVRKRLQVYVLRSRVGIEDISTEKTCIGIPNDAGGADGWSGFPVGKETGVLQFGGPDPGSRLLAAPTEVAERLWREWEDAGYSVLDEEAWSLAEIMAGVPRIAPITSEEFLPQMLNLDLLGGIGLQKGCYTGQEIVARTHYLGQLKRRMFRFRTESASEPQAGNHVYNAASPESRNIGQVVSVAGEIGEHWQMLAVIALDHAGGMLRLQSPEGPLLENLDLPYLS